jgi:hypothetical protein
MNKENVFVRLSRIFRGGPIIKRRIANPSTPKFTPFGAGAHDKFIRQSRELVNYANFVNYQAVDRWSRYSDFAEMESRGEIAATLQIYADETCSLTDKGEILHIRSDNANIKAILETLFFDTLELEFNLPMWVRTLCKYGDFALFNDIDPNYGILRCIPIPITDFQRLEGLNPQSPSDVVYLVNQEVSNRGFSVQYTNVQSNLQAELANMGYNKGNMQSIFDRWGTSNEQGIQLQDWQVEHFRLLGNDLFLPYGTSILDPARRLWRLLYMTEDLMLMYRAYRASERRVFYIDTRNVPADEEENYVQAAINLAKREPAVVPDKNGGFDYIFNPMAMSDDYIVPVKGPDSGTKIDTLQAGSNTAHIEDVEYLHKQMFACLNVPPSYLGYGEGAESFMPTNLSQIHIRFARNIQRIQRVVLQQLYKMAYIQLTCAGFSGEQLNEFTLELASPSSVAQDQYLNNLKNRAEVASSILGVEGLAGRTWVRKHIMGWDNAEAEEAVQSRFDDIKEETKYAAAVAKGEAPEAGEGGGGDDFTFDSLNKEREGELLSEIVRLAEQEGIDEEEAYDILRNSDNLDPYPKVSPKARWGSVGLNTSNEDRDVVVRPLTAVPSPSAKAGWEKTHDEDVISLIEEIVDGNKPIRASKSKSVNKEVESRNASRPLKAKTDKGSGLLSKRVRKGVSDDVLDIDEIVDLIQAENLDNEFDDD